MLALRGIPYGEIKLEIWRGKCGNGVDLRVGGDGGRGEGDEEVEEELGEWMRRRVVQSNWKRMEGEEREQEGGGEGGGGRGGILPAWADWVVDPRWPEGGEEGEDEQEGGRV